jgi:hypothetical protein
MLIALRHKGARRTILQNVFGIGGYRYDHMMQQKDPSKPRDNGRSMSPEDINLLNIVRSSIPISDESFGCNHRQYTFYIADPEMTSVDKIFQKYYVDNEAITTAKRMKKDTFRKYWCKLHSDLRFKKLKEDECDTCIELRIGN